jgi:hypothetical protein
LHLISIQSNFQPKSANIFDQSKKAGGVMSLPPKYIELLHSLAAVEGNINPFYYQKLLKMEKMQTFFKNAEKFKKCSKIHK